jgi:hypothetical protein
MMGFHKPPSFTFQVKIHSYLDKMKFLLYFLLLLFTLSTRNPARPATGKARCGGPDAPTGAFVHIGAGTNFIYVDPDHDLVAVVRWIENAAMDGMVKRIPAAVH